MRHLKHVAPVLLLVAVCSIEIFAQTQTATTNATEPTIKSLLNEVRLLRQTLQNTGLNAYRSQILLERIKINNEQVIRLTRALDGTREELEKTELTIPRMGEQQKMLETMAQSEVDPIKRAQMEFEVKDMKRSIDRYKNRIVQLKDLEQQQATQLREEQTKLGELELRLERLENQIEDEIQRLGNERQKP